MKKKLFQIHEFFGKHMFKGFVANISWAPGYRDIVLCECGAFIDVVLNKEKAITAGYLNNRAYSRKIFKKMKDDKVKNKFLNFFKAQTGECLSLRS